ncbi:alpha/beta hydrolase [Patiriisocius marinistellae]|uniref:Alpha/beta hydrolase n=1 Tax=Patiriisocius marinistellae TaxID=2494560 RepID=A0A5J4G2M1_9FLAO|nr:alpha/beta hydrolase [Patiriisocius marinistellae]GEQ86865.1 alpha/beta hydrolase [Patiriisocius marinistellae]
MKKIAFLILLNTIFLTAQDIKKDVRDISISPLIDGTILTPKSQDKLPLVIFIGGSGPTDRNGNQQMMENNSLRYLAEGLYQNNIASFRYDKRIVKQMKNKTVNEESIRFDDFIKDAVDVFDYFKRADAFSKIYILGHSQGSLVGMIAAQNGADGFISIAGAGQSIDEVIVDQLKNQAPGLEENARIAFAEMKKNGTTSNYSPGLASIFRPAIQPFINSWMKYNPKEEISKLNVPVFIINGDKDLQVQVSEAAELQKAKPGAQFLIVPKMNHILKEIEGNDMENQKSYNNYKMPVMPILIEEITKFIKK